MYILIRPPGVEPPFVSPHALCSCLIFEAITQKAEMRNKKVRTTGRHPIDGLLALVLVSHTPFAVQSVSLHLLNIEALHKSWWLVISRDPHMKLHIGYHQCTIRHGSIAQKPTDSQVVGQLHMVVHLLLVVQCPT